MSEENAARELTSSRALPKAEVHVPLDGAFDPLMQFDLSRPGTG
jgi:hypothetical protein